MEPLKYKDYIYSLSDKNQLSISIVNAPKRETSIYKYYSIDQRSIDALMGHYLYASYPDQFNDIMDCSMYLIDFKHIEKFHYEKFYEVCNAFKSEGFEIAAQQNFEKFRIHFYLWYYSQFGIISFATSPLNSLLWAHYTHEIGFVVRFSVSKLMGSLRQRNKDIESLGINPVQYCKELEPIDFFSECFHNPILQMAYISNVKLEDWRYEDEWRCILSKNNMGCSAEDSSRSKLEIKGVQDRSCHYNLSDIEAIYLGAKFFENARSGIEGENCLVKDEFIPFLNYLFENHNGHLYISIADHSEQNNVTRRNRKISLIRHRRNLFEVVDEERRE